MSEQKMTLKRPSGNEDEDDILKMQEEFLSSKNSPAAKVQRVTKKPEQSSGSSNVGSKPAKVPPDKQLSSDIIDFTDYTADIPVLLAITEKNVGTECVQTPSKLGMAFPRPFKLENASTPSQVKKGVRGRGPSLFAQQMKKKKEQQNLATRMSDQISMDHSSSVETCSPESEMPSNVSRSVSGDPTMDIGDLQKENDARIAAMSLEEVKQYQEQLMEQLNPDVVNFIKSRGKKSGASSNMAKKQIEPSANENLEDSMDFDSPNAPAENSKAVPTDLSMPIAPEEAQKWVNMDKIEYDKLAWMSNLPPAKPLDPNTGHTARFDFQGFLLAHDEEISVHEGLHHHGEEPEVAGYTIEEMFHLSRSSLASQRIIALQTLAKVLHNSNLGLFDKCLNTKLMPQLLDAGVIFLLRIAIDDAQADATGAAIYALHELLVSELDEACLDMMISWHCGQVNPFLVCPKPSTKLSKEEKEEMPDTEIVKEDVILGLLRMDLLPRLRYILEIIKPNDKTIVKHIFGILTRIARHSLQASCQIMDCPRLIKTVFDNFLMMHWSESGETVKSAYGAPMPQALKLVRTLSSAGRHLSKRLMTDFGLRDILNAYIASESSLSNISLVRLEALRTWKILLTYGLASETWLDLFPVLINHYHHCQGLSLLNASLSHDWHYTTLLLSSLQSLLYIAASESKETLIQVFNWNHVANIYSLVSSLVQKWLQELTAFGFTDLTKIGVNAVAAALNVLSTFIQLELVQPNVDTVQISERIRDLWSKSVQPLLQSSSFKYMVTNLSLNSSLLSSCSPGSIRNASNLPFLGAAMFGETEISPSVKEGSIMPLNVSILLFTRLGNRMHCLNQKSVDLVLEAFSCFAKSVISCKHLRRTWFSREEIFLLHSLVHLATSKVGRMQNEREMTLYHKVALLLPSLTGPSESYLTEELFKEVLFHPVFFSEEDKLSVQMMTLQANAPPSLVSAFGGSLETSERLILNDTFASLGAIRELYLLKATALPGIHKSRQILKSDFSQVQSLSVDYEVQEDTLSFDWPVSPLKAAYSQRHKTSKPESEENPVWSATKIRSCLHFLHYLMLARNDFLKQALDGRDLFIWLCSVFLISDDLFLCPEIQSVLHCAFRRLFLLSKPDQLQLEKIKKPVSFLSFYEELVNHYESTSYGDCLFAAIVLIPLQQKYSWLYKQIFLQDVTLVLRRDVHSTHGHVLTLPVNQMLVPLDNYLYPLEEQVEILQIYMKLLLSGALASSPLFRAMSVHHLHHYIFSAKSCKDQQEFLKNIFQPRTLSEASAVLLYKCVDPVNGLQLYSELSEERRKVLEEIGHKELIIKMEHLMATKSG